jgi:hypothetical protein
MRSLAIALLLLTSAARADEIRVSIPAWMLRADLSAQQHAELVSVADRDSARGRRTAIAGIVLSVLGTAMTIGGPLLFVAPLSCEGGCNEHYSGGMAMSSIGPMLLLAGIPTWAAGEAQRHRAKRSRVTLMNNGIRF